MAIQQMTIIRISDWLIHPLIDIFNQWLLVRAYSLCGSAGKESACNVGHLGSIPGLGRSSEGEHGKPLQYSCWENRHGQRSLPGGLQSMGSQKVGHNWLTKHTGLSSLFFQGPRSCNGFQWTMAAVTVHSDFGTQENKVFHCLPIYLPWNDWISCYDWDWMLWLPLELCSSSSMSPLEGSSNPQILSRSLTVTIPSVSSEPRSLSQE